MIFGAETLDRTKDLGTSFRRTHLGEASSLNVESVVPWNLITVPHKASLPLYTESDLLFCISCYRNLKESTTMPALSTLKSNRTRARNALAKEEQEANELLQQDHKPNQ